VNIAISVSVKMSFSRAVLRLIEITPFLLQVLSI
jgi:hypothetical protein